MEESSNYFLFRIWSINASSFEASFTRNMASRHEAVETWMLHRQRKWMECQPTPRSCSLYTGRLFASGRDFTYDTSSGRAVSIKDVFTGGIDRMSLRRYVHSQSMKTRTWNSSKKIYFVLIYTLHIVILIINFTF